MGEDEKKAEKALETTVAKSALEAKAIEAASILPPELAEMVRSQTIINVNNLLVQIGNKTTDPKEFIKDAKELLEIAKAFDQQRLDQFKNHTEALIGVKMRDPDEIEKRKNNRTRRFLKYVVGSGGVVGLLGGIGGLAVTGIPVAIAGLLLASGAVCLTLSAVLASGESVSTNDVVNIVRAVRGLAESSRAIQKPPATDGNARKRGRR